MCHLNTSVSIFIRSARIKVARRLCASPCAPAHEERSRRRSRAKTTGRIGCDDGRQKGNEAEKIHFGGGHGRKKSVIKMEPHTHKKAMYSSRLLFAVATTSKWVLSSKQDETNQFQLNESLCVDLNLLRQRSVHGRYKILVVAKKIHVFVRMQRNVYANQCCVTSDFFQIVCILLFVW